MVVTISGQISPVGSLISQVGPGHEASTDIPPVISPASKARIERLIQVGFLHPSVLQSFFTPSLYLCTNFTLLLSVGC